MDSAQRLTLPIYDPPHQSPTAVVRLLHILRDHRKHRSTRICCISRGRSLVTDLVIFPLVVLDRMFDTSRECVTDGAVWAVP